MRGDILILIEMLLVFGLVFGFGLWQLRSLKKEREADARKAAEAERDGGDDTGPKGGFSS
jgi:cytochrome oxidase assembly protein ShyY1